MTREDIIRMAREAGPLISTPFDLWCDHFAALVAAAAPPKSKPLTEDEIDRAWRSVDYKISYDNFRIEVARAIERAHGIGDKNG